MQYSLALSQKITLLDHFGRAVLYENIFDHHLILLEKVIHEVAWRQDEITLYGKTHLVPRLQAWMADEGATYTYSKIKLDPLSFSPTVLAIKKELELFTGEKFNSCLLNYYRHGNDYVALHADNEPEIGDLIAAVSLGVDRKFVFKRNENKEKIDVSLVGGSLLLMDQGLQKHWKHELPRMKSIDLPRVSLTFRKYQF